MKNNKYARTRTEKKLNGGVRHESQARNKYTYFASVTKKQGFEQIAALFLKTAEMKRNMPSFGSKSFQESEVWLKI